MRNLKRIEMQEHGCIYCRYYDHRACSLESCYIEKKEEGGIAPGIQIRDISLPDCDCCSYRKQGGCNGFCLQKVLVECRSIWDKKRR